MEKLQQKSERNLAWLQSLTSSNLLRSMISRRQTREYLLQTLYARVNISPFDRDIFYGAYFLGDHSLSLDMVYLDGMENLLIANE